jgi:hypothetical protein
MMGTMTNMIQPIVSGNIIILYPAGPDGTFLPRVLATVKSARLAYAWARKHNMEIRPGTLLPEDRLPR